MSPLKVAPHFGQVELCILTTNVADVLSLGVDVESS